MERDCGCGGGEAAPEAPTLCIEGAQPDVRGELRSGPEATSWAHDRVRPCFRAAPWTVAARSQAAAFRVPPGRLGVRLRARGGDRGFRLSIPGGGRNHRPGVRREGPRGGDSGIGYGANPWIPGATAPAGAPASRSPSAVRTAARPGRPRPPGRYSAPSPDRASGGCPSPPPRCGGRVRRSASPPARA